MSEQQTNAKIGTCHACGGTVSKTAKTCPHCGERKPYRPPTNWRKIWIYSGIGFGLYMMMSLMMNSIPGAGPQSRVDAAGDASLEVAIRQCEAAIRASVNNPSTVDIHRFTGFGNDVAADGTRRITQTFSAKNGFGLEQTYDAYCSLTKDGKFDIKINEQGR